MDPDRDTGPSPQLPPRLEADDPARREDARQAIARKSRTGLVAWLQSPKASSRTKRRFKRDHTTVHTFNDSTDPAVVTSSSSLDEIQLAYPSLPQQPKNEYRWAVLYENQRGLTVFSSTYYSRLSLLPTDPPAFTLPYTGLSTSSPGRETPRRQPKITKLSEYPLPDGAWEWVSQAWMVDMRDNGQVQHDGFEYNWLFRRHNWRAEVGKFNAGGWVRRRRWVRLMVRRAEATMPLDNIKVGEVNDSGPNSVRPSPDPSVVGSPSKSDASSQDLSVTIWMGDEEIDWQSCHAALKHLPRDGRKLELWAHWLGLSQHTVMSPVPSSLNLSDTAGTTQASRRKQWTEDDEPLPSEVTYTNRVLSTSAHAPLEYVKPVVNRHLGTLLEMFVYPDSRVRFIEQLAQADLLPNIVAGARTDGGGESLISREFWSYVHELGKDAQPQDASSTDISRSCFQLQD